MNLMVYKLVIFQKFLSGSKCKQEPASVPLEKSISAPSSVCRALAAYAAASCQVETDVTTPFYRCGAGYHDDECITVDV